MGAERFDLQGRTRRGAPQVGTIEHSPYKAYRLRSRRGGPADMKLWLPRARSRRLAPGVEPPRRIPGDGTYLEFHKIRWPGGLKLWRVTGNGIDLGEKQRMTQPRHAAVPPTTQPTSCSCSAVSR